MSTQSAFSPRPGPGWAALTRVSAVPPFLPQPRRRLPALGGQVLRAALASPQHWRAECHGSTVCVNQNGGSFSSQLQTSLATRLIHSYQLPEMGAWPYLGSPEPSGAQGFPPDCEPPRASSLRVWISTFTWNPLTSLWSHLPSTFNGAVLYSKYSGSPCFLSRQNTGAHTP